MDGLYVYDEEFLREFAELLAQPATAQLLDEDCDMEDLDWESEDFDAE